MCMSCRLNNELSDARGQINSTYGPKSYFLQKFARTAEITKVKGIVLTHPVILTGYDAFLVCQKYEES